MGETLLIKNLEVIWKLHSANFGLNKIHSAFATYAKKIDKNETKINWNLILLDKVIVTYSWFKSLILEHGL